MCGIVGIANVVDAAAVAVLTLQGEQHRGQDGAGVLTWRNRRRKQFRLYRELGLVGDHFTAPKLIQNLNGTFAIGHTRYRTSGERVLEVRNGQPLFAESLKLGVVHNGHITNAKKLRIKLEKEGALFASTTDTEVILHLIAKSQRNSVEERIHETLLELEGAYSLIFLTPDKLIGVRDPHGFRPLVLGRWGESKQHVLVSETCPLRLIAAKPVRDINPGEMVTINGGGEVCFSQLIKAAKPSFCVFEYIYLSRPDSTIGGLSVGSARERTGRLLAKNHPLSADIVVPVPDSGVPAALGFSKESGLPFGFGLVRNHYVGRTFIQPTQKIRRLGVRLKHTADEAVVGGKDVVLVDDSAVRGNTSRKIVEEIRAAGAKRVHLRIASPMVIGSCHYGVDTPSRQELLATKMESIEKMATFLGVDSLAFLSISEMHEAISGKSRAECGMCDACFSGDYPTL